MTIFIMNFNWLRSVVGAAKFFTDCNHTVVIVDNGSTYKPLLDWYNECPYRVVTTEGVELETFNRFIWEIPGLLDGVGEFYAVADSDLDYTGVPTDFCEVLTTHLQRTGGILKCGLSIRLSDLPNNPYANRYKDAEKNNWSNQDEYGFYSIPVDTTFAIYSKERCQNIAGMWRPEGTPVPTSFLDNFYFFRSHRSPEPYTVRHRPWYMDINNLSEEEQYHIKVTRHGSILFFKSTYAKELLELYNIDQNWVDPATITQ